MGIFDSIRSWGSKVVGDVEQDDPSKLQDLENPDNLINELESAEPDDIKQELDQFGINQRFSAQQNVQQDDPNQDDQGDYQDDQGDDDDDQDDQ